MSSHPIEVRAEEAIKIIKPGDRIFIDQAMGEPLTLADALYEAREELTDVEIIGGPWVGECKYIRKEVKGHFRLLTFLVRPNMREAIQEGIADYIPAKLSDVHHFFRSDGPLPLDVALIGVAPPDKNGNCSLGIAINYALDAALQARLVIAEVNEEMPRTLGDCSLPLSRIHYLVHSSRPLLEYPLPTIGEKEKRIGENVASLIPNGASIEIGIGGIPSAILASLYDKSDLGVHSGMISDEIISLVEKGVITNLEKPINKGKIVTAMLAGSRKLYRYAHENPLFEFYPYRYTHDLHLIAKLPKFISINSAVEIDLSGQVNAETLGGVQIAGVGGQADWVRGAAISRGGMSIIALDSTAARGTRSRIVPCLDPRSAITTPRYDVDFVVTEYGIADLRGKSLKQRAEAIIPVAHPDFRDLLKEQYKKGQPFPRRTAEERTDRRLSSAPRVTEE